MKSFCVLGCWFEQKKYGLRLFGLWEIPVSKQTEVLDIVHVSALNKRAC